jgi:Trp operon repressor
MEQIKQLIASLNASMAEFQNATNYARNVTKECEEKIQAIGALNAKLTLKEKDLSDREQKVGRVENLLEREIAARELEKKLGVANDTLVSERMAFEKAKNDALKAVAEGQAKLADDNILLERGWQDLRAKEASYKDEIKQEMLKRIK